MSHSPTPDAATGRTMEYFGGPVIPNAKVYVVWWGNPSNLNPAITAAHGGIADFFAGVTNSTFLDWLSEYNTNIAVQAGTHAGSAGTGQRIGRGNYAGTLTLSAIPAGNVTDAQIQSTLDQAFAAGTLPPPDENTIYALYFPSSVTITSAGSTSCGAFLAYHGNTVETARHNAYYLVMPDCGSDFPGTTVTSSHELMEAITDGMPTPGSNPDYPQAWNNSSGSEVGDVCSGSGTVATGLGTFSVQTIWDELSQGCQISTTATQDFNVDFATNSAPLAAGGTATFTVQTATVAGAAQTLTLTTTVPPGLTASLSPTTLTSGQSATLTLTAAVGTATNALQVIVRADGAAGGAASHSAALLLQASAVASNDFSVAVAPASATVAAGISVTLNVTTTVTSGSAEPVALTLSGLPAGVTAAFNPASVTSGGASTLTLTSSSTAAASSSTLTVTGTSGGTRHTATASLTVTTGTPPPPSALVNGDFEAGTLAGWTSVGSTSSSTSAHTGSHAGQAGAATATNGDSSLSQTFAAPANATSLSFWYSVHCPDTVQYDWATATLTDNTAGTTATVLAKTCNNAGWTQVTQAITGGHSYTLTLTNHDDNYAGDPTFTLFDDVTLTAGTPPPPPPPPPAGGITNGGFETNGLSGWTTSGTVSASASAHSGATAAEAGAAGPTSGDSSLSQSFTVPAGKSGLSFWYSNNCPDSVQYDWATATLVDTTAGTTTTVLAKTCTATASWTQVTSTVTAGHSYTLTLTNHDDNYAGDPTFTLFDDVTLN